MLFGEGVAQSSKFKVQSEMGLITFSSQGENAAFPSFRLKPELSQFNGSWKPLDGIELHFILDCFKPSILLEKLSQTLFYTNLPKTCGAEKQHVARI